MADTEEQWNPLLEGPDFAEEIAEISADQDAIVDRIAALEKEADRAVVYPVERVRGGVGRWLIPKKGSLAAHYALVKDKERDIDFSPANYPGFDSIIAERYQGKGFFDPLNDNFEKYTPLRDNLATVRNYMLQLYFPDNSPDDQLRIAHLHQISEYLAEGMNNDRAFLGLIPIHNPFKPFIDIQLASAPDGEGARYLYQKILEMQRQSNWTRPFTAITTMFGGATYGKWDLPNLQDSSFARDANEVDAETIGAQIAGLSTAYDTLEVKRMQLAERQHQSDLATDVDTIANQLLFSFYQMRDAVEDLSAPIKREAIDIAHDILRKLSVKLGASSVTSGISFQPADGDAALGSSSGVGRMLVRMTGMMRALGQDMLTHPVVADAHLALGQMAYLAKLEALNMANAAGDTKLSGSIRSQLTQLRRFGQGLEGKSFGDLLDKMKAGLSVLQQQLQSAGLVVDGHEVEQHAAGTGAASQSQAVNTARQQQAQKQYTTQTKQQQGLNSAQQGQAAQTVAQVQAAVTQAQAAQKAATPPGQQPSAFSQQAVTVKKAPNGAAAIKNAKRAVQTAKAQANQAAITAPPPPAPPKGVDPHILAGLGQQLRNAQTSANTLSAPAIGPRKKGNYARTLQDSLMHPATQTHHDHEHVADTHASHEHDLLQHSLQEQLQQQLKPGGGRSR